MSLTRRSLFAALAALPFLSKLAPAKRCSHARCAEVPYVYALRCLDCGAMFDPADGHEIPGIGPDTVVEHRWSVFRYTRESAS